MFKFLRGQKKQQNTENAGIPDPPAPDTINYESAESGLEEVLKPLFLREEPISPEEFASKCNIVELILLPFCGR